MQRRASLLIPHRCRCPLVQQHASRLEKVAFHRFVKERGSPVAERGIEESEEAAAFDDAEEFVVMVATHGSHGRLHERSVHERSDPTDAPCGGGARGTVEARRSAKQQGALGSAVLCGRPRRASPPQPLRTCTCSLYHRLYQPVAEDLLSAES